MPEGRALCAALPFHDMLNGIGIGIDIVVGDGVGVCVSVGIGILHDMVDILWQFADRHIVLFCVAQSI